MPPTIISTTSIRSNVFFSKWLRLLTHRNCRKFLCFFFRMTQRKRSITTVSRSESSWVSKTTNILPYRFTLFDIYWKLMINLLLFSSCRLLFLKIYNCSDIILLINRARLTCMHVIGLRRSHSERNNVLVWQTVDPSMSSLNKVVGSRAVEDTRFVGGFTINLTQGEPNPGLKPVPRP